MSHLITGAGGSIGSELTRLLAKTDEPIVIVDSSEFALFKIYEELVSNGYNKITPILSRLDDLGEIITILKENCITKIYNAAAYKHVNLVEQNKMSGLKNNLQIVINILEAASAVDQKIEIIHISTDKAVKPINMMGFSKRVCEIYLQHFSKSPTKIVRFGNVLDSSGSVVPIFRNQIKKRGPVTVTSFRAKRYFMTITQACQLIISVEGEAMSAGTYVLDMGEAQSILSLAKKMIKDFGFQHTFTSENDKIQIVEIGLRKGEKEEEELTSGSLRASTVEKINCAVEDYSPLDKKIIKIFQNQEHLNKFEELLSLYDDSSS